MRRRRWSRSRRLPPRSAWVGSTTKTRARASVSAASRRSVSAQTGEAVSLESIRNGEHRDACAGITLVSATDGNHGRSLAWGCERFGAPCNIYIHAEVSEGRAEAMRRYGANVIRIDGDYDESVRLANVMSGYGVMTLEACEALAEPPTHVFLQGGVGGMAAGVAAALRQHYGDDSPRVVIVEPELAACLFESAKSGTATSVAIETETIMAGLSCGEPSPLAWEILAEEASVIAARQNDALSAQLGLDADARVLLFGSEGVTDPEIFEKIMAGSDAL